MRHTYVVCLRHMTYAKLEAFTEEQQELAKLAKALCHPARIAIMQHLASVGTCISGDIANELPLARATVSQHLQELKAAGLIKGTIDGQKICYCLDEEGILALERLSQSLIAFKVKATCC